MGKIVNYSSAFPPVEETATLTFDFASSASSSLLLWDTYNLHLDEIPVAL